MLVSTRRDALLDAVQREGSAMIADLAAELGVSSMTVRRDIDLLADEGKVVKVRGGVTVAEDPSASSKRRGGATLRYRREKQAIARLATTIVEPGMSVGLSAGSTTWCVARELRAVPQLTVVTNSLAIADLLAEDPGGDVPAPAVVLTGGVRTPADALVGPVAVRSLAELHCDVVFVSVQGIDPRAGFTTPNLLEAETNRGMLAAGLHTVVVADHSKWGGVSLRTVADLDGVTTVVIDDGLTPQGAAELRGYLTDLRLAPRAAQATGEHGR